MEAMAQKAVTAIESYKQDKIIMDFVTSEALQQVSNEMNQKGFSTTAKGVSVLIMSKRNFRIKERVEQYIDAGLFGCWMAAQ